jgi:hypothetical protein
MADEKKVDDVIELVAVERGFAMGRMVEPGTKFMFRAKTADGKARKLPKWAQPSSQPVAKKPEAKNGDLKPKDAQAAVAAKAGVLGGATPPAGDSLA